MGFFGSIFRATAKGIKGIAKSAAKGLKSAYQSAQRGVKAGIERVKKLFGGRGKEKPWTKDDVPKLSDTLRSRGAFKLKGQPKVPYEPPIKLRNPKRPINKGRALNDPI
jgi:hypothetical protein